MFCDNCGKGIDVDMSYCPSCGYSLKKTLKEEFVVSSDELVKRVKELIHEGNITRIIVKNEKDQTLIEIPATVGVIGAIMAPWMAALGVIAALATKCKIIVEKRAE